MAGSPISSRPFKTLFQTPSLADLADARRDVVPSQRIPSRRINESRDGRSLEYAGLADTVESSSESDSRLDAALRKHGAMSEAPTRPSRQAPDLDAALKKYGAVAAPQERRLDDKGRLRDIDPFGNLVPRSFSSSAPRGPSQRTSGPWDEPKFQAWYAGHAKTQGLDPNPDSPLHYYDYRAAFKAGAAPGPDGHWPSTFKRDGHPNLIVDGVNTRTGGPAPPPRTFAQSVGGGVDQLQGMTYGAAEAAGELVGSDAATAFGREGRERNAIESQSSGPAATFSGIDSPTAFGQWAKETIGNQIPIMAPSMAGGGAGALVGAAVGGPPGAAIGALIGAFAPSYVLGVGEVQVAIKERGGTAPAAAFVGGSAVAALDSVLPGKVGGRLVSWLGREVAEDVATRALLKPARAGLVRRITADGAKGMATEGLTEALQEAAGEVSVMVGTNSGMDPALPSRMLEVGAAGALLGVTGAIQGRPSGPPTALERVSEVLAGAGIESPVAAPTPPADQEIPIPSDVEPQSWPEAAPVTPEAPAAVEATADLGDDTGLTLSAGITDDQRVQLEALGYDPNAMTIVDAQEVLRAGLPERRRAPRAVRSDPMTPEGRAEMANAYANDPAQQAAVEKMRNATRAEAPPRGQPEAFAPVAAKVPARWFHGTRSGYDVAEPSEDGEAGPGIYLTASSEVAGRRYALREDMDEYDEETDSAGANVRPVKLREGVSLFNASHGKATIEEAQALIDALEAIGSPVSFSAVDAVSGKAFGVEKHGRQDRASLFEWFQRRGSNNDGPAMLNRALAEAGYGGVLHLSDYNAVGGNGSGVETVVVFDPKDIVSLLEQPGTDAGTKENRPDTDLTDEELADKIMAQMEAENAEPTAVETQAEAKPVPPPYRKRAAKDAKSRPPFEKAPPGGWTAADKVPPTGAVKVGTRITTSFGPATVQQIADGKAKVVYANPTRTSGASTWMDADKLRPYVPTPQVEPLKGVTPLGRRSVVEDAPTSTPSNAEILADAKARIKSGAAVSHDDAAILRDLASEESDANADAIDVTPLKLRDWVTADEGTGTVIEVNAAGTKVRIDLNDSGRPSKWIDVARVTRGQGEMPSDAPVSWAHGGVAVPKPVDPKRAALAEKRAKAKADIDKAADALKAELRKAGNTLNTGVPLPPKAVVVQTVNLVRAYARAGIVEVDEGWQSFVEDLGELAASARRAFQLAWKSVHGTEPALADLPLEGQDGETSRGSADGGQLPAARGAAADAAGAEGQGALGSVQAEDDGRAVEEPDTRPDDSEAGASDGVRDRGGRGEDGADTGGDRADIPGPALSPTGVRRDPGHGVGDYQLTPERIEAIVSRGAMERARDNLKALQIAKDLMAEKRHATADEQEALSRYVGWGDISVGKFLGEREDYEWSRPAKAIWQEIQNLTTPDERRKLVHSTLNAHYTFDIYRPLWSALEAAGFGHGRILEPAVGSGHAFGLMPAEMRQLSTLNAVELEPLTATIAQALYPSARVQASGFEKARLPQGTQDLVISNVPFGAYGVTDSRMPAFLTDRIHNYFFAKSLQYTRPGGLVVFVTTHFTMDAAGAARVRRHLMEQAHFVGAVRLPNSAFGKGAKTEVVTDIVILQRKMGDEAARNAADFIDVVDTANGGRSKWYDAHPELVLGQEDSSGKMYGRPGSYNVVAPDGQDLQKALAVALGKVLPAGTYEPARAVPAKAADLERAEDGARFGELSVGAKGQVFRVNRRMELEPIKVDAKGKARLTAMIGLRGKLRDLVGMRRARTATDAGYASAQKALKKAYDAFVDRHGLLNDRINRALFSADPEAANLLALEVLESKAETTTAKDGTEKVKITRQLKRLSDLFTRGRDQRAEIVADTPKAALLASLGVHVGIQWNYMAQVSGTPVETLRAALVEAGLVYEQPNGAWVTNDEYLSGDVVSKLADADAADDPKFARNVEDLKRVQPIPKTPDDMRIAIGAHWVDPKHYQAFLADQLGVQKTDVPRPHMVGTSEVGKWSIDWSKLGHEARRSAQRHALAVEYGPHSVSEDAPFGKGYIFSATDLFEDALNLKFPTLSWTVKTGDTSITIKAPEATLAARGNLEELQAEWEAWLTTTQPDVLAELTDTYNERFNRTVERKFDGDHLRAHLKNNGLALPFELHPHQVDAIWRGLVGGNILLAHEVGAGKTFEMIALAMEMRRTGRARKPLITVPTYLLGQWRDDVLRAYPGAKILAFDENDMEAKKRQEAMARIAFGDWDIVLVPHSSFELLKVSPDRMTATLEEMKREVEDVELETKAREGGKSPNLKELAKMRARIEAKIEKLLARTDKGSDTNLYWEDLGVDALLVDEAQAFKNLWFFSNMDNVRGISKSDSDRSLGMLVKVKEINETSRYRNLVMATATPVMNSLVEIYTFQRYLQPQELDEQGLKGFDNWYRMYGKAVPRTEKRPDGSYQEVLRVAEFRNLEHLSATTRGVMDYVGWEDMPYLDLPKLEGDRIDIVQTPRHPMYDGTLQPWFAKRLAILKAFPPRYDEKKKEYIAPDRIHPITGEPTGKKDNILAVMSDARKAAIDVRLVLGSAAKDFAGSRIQTAADRIWKSYKAEKSRKGVQLAFLDWGTPSSPSPLGFLKNAKVEMADDVATDDVDQVTDDEAVIDFDDESTAGMNLYDLLRGALVKRGIPEDEIAYVHQARNSGERTALFTAAQEGRVRVVIASTDKGGVGMNIQHRLSDIHEIDVPRAMRPGDIRQRLGRGIRQGNSYKRIRVHRYITKGTTDEWLYGLIGAKQGLTEKFMRGEATEFSEPDPMTMSVEQAQMLSSGDPRGAELVELKSKIGRLKSQAQSAKRALATARLDVKSQGERKTRLEKELVKASTFLENTFTSLRGDAFSMTVGGTRYTKRGDAQEALGAAVVAFSETDANDTDEKVLGQIGGLDVTAEWKLPLSWQRDTAPSVVVSIDARAAGEQELLIANFDVVGPAMMEGRNVVQSLVNRYEDLGRTVKNLTAEADEAGRAVERAKAIIASPPAVIDRYDVAQRRIDDLDATFLRESKAKDEALALEVQQTVSDMKMARQAKPPAMKAPSGDASVAPTVQMVTVRDGQSATLPMVAADQMGTSTARPVFVPELVEFIESVGGETKILRALRTFGARGMHQEGTIKLVADLFAQKNRAELGRVLAHEIGHLVDWLPDQDTKRGNLLGRLRSLQGFLKHRYTSADGDTIKVKDVRDELLALSREWRPWPDDAGAKYDAYRRRGRELYADALSALLNDPAAVKATAPIFFKEFFLELDGKPEVKRAYFEVMDVLSGTPDELIERRRGRVREMFDYGNTKSLDLVALKLREKDLQAYSLWDRFRIQQVDRNTAAMDLIADHEKTTGVPLPQHEDPRYLLEERVHIGATVKAFVQTHFQPVIAAIRKADIDWNMFGELLFYERIIHDPKRAEIANSKGIGPIEAQQMLDKALKPLSLEQRRVVTAQADKFRAALKLVAEKAHAAGLYSDEMYAEMQKNPAYVTFRVIEYLDQNVTSTVYRQVGTLKDIQHPAESSILKAIVTLKAAEHNIVKRDTFQWFDTHMPGQIVHAPLRWDGRGQSPQAPRERELALVTFKEHGQTVGRHVDLYLEKAFTTLETQDMHVALEALNFLTSKYLRPVFTVMNPGFMTFSFARDIQRGWKAVNALMAETGRETVTVRGWLADYVKAVPMAATRAVPIRPDTDGARWRQRATAALNAAGAAKILGLTLNDLYDTKQIEDTNIDQLFSDAGLSEYSQHKGLIGTLLGWIKTVGDFTETLPKAAALVRLTRDGRSISDLTPLERRYVRDRIGNPDYLQRGTYTPTTNVLFIFSNAIIRGTRADIKMARNPTTAAGWWYRTALLNIAPKMAIRGLALAAAASAVAGGDDDESALELLARLYRGASEYNLSNYTVVPLGFDDKGEPIYVRIPQDDSGRFIGALAWKAMGLAMGDRDIVSSLMHVADVTAGQAPGLNPLIQVPADITALASGDNVYDSFRSRMVFTQNELKARDSRMLKKFLRYEFQQLGASIVWNFSTSDKPSDAKSTLQKVVEYPVVSNIVGRWVIVGDRGTREALRDAAGLVERDESRAREDEKERLPGAISQVRKSAPPQRQQAAKAEAAAIVRHVYSDLAGTERTQKTRAIEKKIRMGLVRGEADPYVEALLSQATNRQKLGTIASARKAMSPLEFQGWIRRAVSEGIISEALAKAARKGPM